MSRSTPNKLSPTDKVIVCWALSTGKFTRPDLARRFGVSETTIYNFQRRHREHDPHAPYCRGLTR